MIELGIISTGLTSWNSAAESFAFINFALIISIFCWMTVDKILTVLYKSHIVYCMIHILCCCTIFWRSNWFSELKFISEEIKIVKIFLGNRDKNGGLQNYSCPVLAKWRHRRFIDWAHRLSSMGTVLVFMIELCDITYVTLLLKVVYCPSARVVLHVTNWQKLDSYNSYGKSNALIGVHFYQFI